MQIPLGFETDQEIYQSITQNLQKKRLALNILQKDLAAKAGISKLTLLKFEAGEEVRVLTLFKIMRALGESSRLQALVIEDVESPKELFEYEQKNANAKKKKKKKTRKRAHKE